MTNRRDRRKVIEATCRVPVEPDADYFDGLCGLRALYAAYTFRGRKYGPFCQGHAIEAAEWIQQQREQGDTE